jgi:lipopolysaccharide transport system ATP-binding protein
MENKEIAIKLSGVKKMYKLGQIGGGTLQADLQSWWARIRGKEDPNTKIGTDQRLVGQTFMALNGIDLTIYKGEALGIIGGNGAGKSTMLKLLSRVTAPYAGEIDIYGRIASMLEVGTGFSPEMTGRENVYMNGAILGMTKAEIDAKMEDIIEFSEVREFIDTPVKRYSSGMYVKLAFSVAAHLDSEIMIMDEVLAVGDMAFQKKCLDKMRDAAKKEGRTVLYVSHNMNTIRQLCDRCIVLDKGKVVFEGNVEEAIDIYLRNECNADKVEIDLRNAKTRNPTTQGLVRLEYLKLLNKELPIYKTNETIRFLFRFKTTRPFSNLKLRLELRYGNDVPVGTVPFIPLGDLSIPGTHEFTIKFTPEGVTPGKYSVSMVLFEFDEFGETHDHELLVPAFYFEIRNDEEIVWDQTYWGHIRFDNAVIE